MQVDYYAYNTLEFTCPACGWQGMGKELSHGDFSELSLIGDLECPKCFHMIAFWQAPVIDKKKYKEPGKNPD